jgi:hypothetical protein
MSLLAGVPDASSNAAATAAATAARAALQCSGSLNQARMHIASHHVAYCAHPGVLVVVASYYMLRAY